MPRVLCVLDGVQVTQDDDGRVWFVADAAIDADGANGESKHPTTGAPLFAYAPDDRGLDLLRNAGYPNGSYRDILVCNARGGPIPQPGGGYYSRTAYERIERDPRDPQRYLDACAVPYIVVENFIRRRAKGVVLGCKARVTYPATQQMGDGRWQMEVNDITTVDCVVGDIGPLYKIGELSIAAADGLGIPSNPRTGGLESKSVLYELWPGLPAILNGEQFDLIRYVPQ